MDTKKVEWEDATANIRMTYLDRAEYLIERGYIEDIDKWNLAKKLYDRE